MKKNIIKIITILLIISLYSCGEKSTLNYEEYFLEAGFFEKTIKSEINFKFDECLYLTGNLKTKSGEKSGSIILNVENRENPKFINAINQFGYGQTYNEKKLYIANWEKGMDVYDIRKPYKIKKKYHYGEKWGLNKLIYFYKNWIYFFGEDGLDIIEDKNWKAEKVRFLAGNWRSGGIASYQNYGYIAVNTDYIYEVRIMDFIEKSNPKIVNYLEYTASKVDVYGQELYISTGTKIYILSLKDPENPELISVIGEYAKDIVFFENYILVANDFEEKISIYDISDIKMPKKLSEIINLKEIDSMGIVDEYLYIAQKNKGLGIYKIDEGNRSKFITRKKRKFL